MSIGNQKISFEPEFRASLEGKPWNLILWWRYKFLNDDKFKFNVGAHPALSFKTVPTNVAGVQRDIIKVNRFLAGELSFSYLLSKNTSIGSYYLYSRGIEYGTTRNTHFLTLNSSFSNIKLSDAFALRFSPQVYYLKMDANDGVFFSSTLTLTKKNSPISVSALVNKIIKTDINTKNFVWNATNITAQLRMQLIELFESYRGKVTIIYVEVPYKMLIKQNNNRDEIVPQVVLDKMVGKLEPPVREEANSIKYFV